MLFFILLVFLRSFFGGKLGFVLLLSQLAGLGLAGIADGHDYPDTQQHHKNAHNTEYLDKAVVAGDKHCKKTHDGGNAVEHSNGLLLAQTGGHEPVVEVTLIRMEGTLPL